MSFSIMLMTASSGYAVKANLALISKISLPRLGLTLEIRETDTIHCLDQATWRCKNWPGIEISLALGTVSKVSINFENLIN